MVKVTPEEFADKWGKRLKGSTVEMKRGADRVTVSPGVTANENIDLMLAKLIEAFESGKVSRGLLGFTLEEWKEKFKTKGMSNLGAGIDAAKDKQIKFGAWLIARVKAGQEHIKDMPKLTLEDKIARMNEFTRFMAKEKYK